MSRSKRKRAAQASQDFARKKTKLGKKVRPDNFTDTSLSTRQIHIPQQARATPAPLSPTAAPPTGLSLSDLLARATHHNHHTRTSSLNALSNAFTNTSAIAHRALSSRPHAAIATAAAALSDSTPTTRVAATALLSAALSSTPDPSPLLPPLAPALAAALTHVRRDICLSTARAIPTLLNLPCLTPAKLFARADPLAPLSDLLSVTPAARARADVLSALCAVLPSVDPNSPSAQSSSTPSRLRDRPFYFHARAPRTTPPAAVVPTRAGPAVLDKLTIRVANAVSEALPSRDGLDHQRGVDAAAQLNAGATALSQLVTVLCVMQLPPSDTLSNALSHALSLAKRHAAHLSPAVALALARATLPIFPEHAPPLLERAATAPAGVAALARLLPRVPADARPALRERWAQDFATAVRRRDPRGVARTATALTTLAGELPSVARDILPDALVIADGQTLLDITNAALVVVRNISDDGAFAKRLISAAVSRKIPHFDVASRVAAEAARHGTLLCDEVVAAVVRGARDGGDAAELAARLCDCVEWAVAAGVGGRRMVLAAVAMARVVEATAAKAGEDVMGSRLRAQMRRIVIAV